MEHRARGTIRHEIELVLPRALSGTAEGVGPDPLEREADRSCRAGEHGQQPLGLTRWLMAGFAHQGDITGAPECRRVVRLLQTS